MHEQERCSLVASLTQPLLAIRVARLLFRSNLCFCLASSNFPSFLSSSILPPQFYNTIQYSTLDRGLLQLRVGRLPTPPQLSLVEPTSKRIRNCQLMTKQIMIILYSVS